MTLSSLVRGRGHQSKWVSFPGCWWAPLFKPLALWCWAEMSDRELGYTFVSLQSSQRRTILEMLLGFLELQQPSLMLTEKKNSLTWVAACVACPRILCDWM